MQQPKHSATQCDLFARHESSINDSPGAADQHLFQIKELVNGIWIYSLQFRAFILARDDCAQ